MEEKNKKEPCEQEKTDPESKCQNPSEIYPSAAFVLTYCLQDYERIQERYDKIYEKISIALALTGVILTIMLGELDFSSAERSVSTLKVNKLVLIIGRLVFLIGSLLIMIGATIYLLMLLRGRSLMVFKSEDIRNEEIYREKEEFAAVWLIDKYTQIVNNMRPIVQKKQRDFDITLRWIIVGIILYAIAIILGKAGY